jgi:hypothetical protein
VGIKMLVADVYDIPLVLSLGLIAVVLAISVAASLLFPKAAEEIPTTSASVREP